MSSQQKKAEAPRGVNHHGWRAREPRKGKARGFYRPQIRIDRIYTSFTGLIDICVTALHFRSLPPGRASRRASRDSDAPSVGLHLDRKSTRLNSSHLVISYAAFCL